MVLYHHRAPLALSEYEIKGFLVTCRNVKIYLQGKSSPVFSLGCSSLVGCSSIAMWNVSFWKFCVTALWSMKLFVSSAWCQTCLNSDKVFCAAKKGKAPAPRSSPISAAETFSVHEHLLRARQRHRLNLLLHCSVPTVWRDFHNS